MKYLLKRFLCLPLCLLLIQSSCKKNKEELQIYTYGSYKFAAKVNGQDFIPSGDMLTFITPIDIYFVRSINNPTITNLYVLARRIDKHERISVYIKNVTGPGRYTFNTYTTGYPNEVEPANCGMYDKDNNSGISNEWVSNDIDTGYVEISQYKLTEDAHHNVVKGTFYFKARSLNDGSVVEVTKGYFSKN